MDKLIKISFCSDPFVSGGENGDHCRGPLKPNAQEAHNERVPQTEVRCSSVVPLNAAKPVPSEAAIDKGIPPRIVDDNCADGSRCLAGSSPQPERSQQHHPAKAHGVTFAIFLPSDLRLHRCKSSARKVRESTGSSARR